MQIESYKLGHTILFREWMKNSESSYYHIKKSDTGKY